MKKPLPETLMLERQKGIRMNYGCVSRQNKNFTDVVQKAFIIYAPPPPGGIPINFVRAITKSRYVRRCFL
jgi:hypothetical protein